MKKLGRILGFLTITIISLTIISIIINSNPFENVMRYTFAEKSPSTDDLGESGDRLCPVCRPCQVSDDPDGSGPNSSE